MSIPTDDRGLLLGDGLFETVLARAGRLVFWDEHVARLERGCRALGLPLPSPDALLTAAVAAIADTGLWETDAAVRLTWTAGSGGRGLDRPAELTGRFFAKAAPAPRNVQPLRLMTATVRRNETSPSSRFKTLSYLDCVLARDAARRAGADEALMLNTRGELACAAAANLFWAEGEKLFTPALDCGVLDGIVRGVLVSRVAVSEARAGPERLAGGSAIYLTNSLMGVRAVSALDGRDLAQDEPMLARLRAALSEMA